MTKLILHLFLAVSLLSSLQAQESKPTNFCGTAPGKTAWLEQYQRNKNLFPERSFQTIYMPMTVTILANDDGSVGYSINNILDEICQLNEDFKPVGIYFYLDSPIRTINNTLWNNHKKYEEGDGIFNNNVAKTINTYYGSDAAGNCGYTLPGTGIVLAKGCMGAASHTWAHEMGHELSLPHTFSGWEGIVYSAGKPTPDSIEGFPVELVDRSNCSTAGDGFCDTPADYLSDRWTCNNVGKSAFELKDPLGKTFRSDGTFFMSYSNEACMSRFSNEQMDAMRANCLSEKLEMVNTTLDIKTITETTKLLSPDNNAQNVKAEDVVLQWTKVKDASHYFYEAARNKSFGYIIKRGFTSDTFAVLPTLLQGKECFWRVRPFNLKNTCKVGNSIAYNVFRTENSTSNVLDINDLGAISVFPNPIGKDEVLMIKINAVHDGMIMLSLNDLNGRLIAQQNNTLIDGENIIEFATQNLAAGMYLLSIEAPEGRVQRKVVVY
jgi:hypothetical protein